MSFIDSLTLLVLLFRDQSLKERNILQFAITVTAKYAAFTSGGILAILTLEVLLPIYMEKRNCISVFKVSNERAWNFFPIHCCFFYCVNYFALVIYSMSFHVFETFSKGYFLHCLDWFVLDAKRFMYYSIFFFAFYSSGCVILISTTSFYQHFYYTSIIRFVRWRYSLFTTRCRCKTLILWEPYWVTDIQTRRNNFSFNT